MNWKNLGNATLITAVLFGIVALVIVLGHYYPWSLVVIAFVGLTAIIYRAIEKDSYDTDNDDEEENE